MILDIFVRIQPTAVFSRRFIPVCLKWEVIFVFNGFVCVYDDGINDREHGGITLKISNYFLGEKFWETKVKEYYYTVLLYEQFLWSGINFLAGI
jgi:hypothetical protein